MAKRKATKKRDVGTVLTLLGIIFSIMMFIVKLLGGSMSWVEIFVPLLIAFLIVFVISVLKAVLKRI